MWGTLPNNVLPTSRTTCTSKHMVNTKKQASTEWAIPKTVFALCNYQIDEIEVILETCFKEV
jgi:hypothetical protein